MTIKHSIQKVAIFLPSGLSGGAENLLLNIAFFLKCNNFHVTIFLLSTKNINSFKDKISKYGINVYDSGTRSEFIGLFKLGNVIRKTQSKIEFDYVISSHVHLNGFITFCRRLNILKAGIHCARESTLIFRRFSGLKLLYFKFWYKFGYEKIEKVICQTSQMRSELLNNVLLNPHAVHVIQNPAPQFNSGAMRNPYKKGKYFVAAGRLIPEKGFDLLVDAMSKLEKEHPDINLIILGEGIEHDNLKKQIDNLGLNNTVDLLGWQQNVYDYFKYAEVCIISSRIEGFPNTLLQMMSVNEKVVCTECTDNIRFINGLHICPPNDSNALYNTVLDCLLSKGEENRGKFDKFLDENSMENYVKKILNFN